MNSVVYQTSEVLLIHQRHQFNQHMYDHSNNAQYPAFSEINLIYKNSNSNKTKVWFCPTHI